MNRKAPYYLAAKAALVNWNGMDPTDAQNMIDTVSRAEIESAVGAHGSVYDAARRIGVELGLNEQETYLFTQEMLGTTSSTQIMDEVKDRLDFIKVQNRETVEKMLANLVLDSCDQIHTGWTGRNTNVFFGKKNIKDQQYQYATSEFIGWKEVKSDLLFLSPILDAIGIGVDENLLKQVYAERVANSLLDIKEKGGLGIEGVGGPGIDTIVEMIDVIDNIENRNRILLSDEIVAAWENDKGLVAQIASEISTKGIGADQELMDALIEKGILNKDDPAGLEGFDGWTDRS